MDLSLKDFLASPVEVRDELATVLSVRSRSPRLLLAVGPSILASLRDLTAVICKVGLPRVYSALSCIREPPPVFFSKELWHTLFALSVPSLRTVHRVIPETLADDGEFIRGVCAQHGGKWFRAASERLRSDGPYAISILREAVGPDRRIAFHSLGMGFPEAYSLEMLREYVYRGELLQMNDQIAFYDVDWPSRRRVMRALDTEQTILLLTNSDACMTPVLATDMYSLLVDEVKGDYTIAKCCIIRGMSFFDIPDHLQRDRDLMMVALCNDAAMGLEDVPLLFQLPAEYQGDQQMVWAAMASPNRAKVYAMLPDHLQLDIRLVHMLQGVLVRLTEFLPLALFSSPNVLVELVRIDSHYYIAAPFDSRYNEEAAMIIVERHEHFLLWRYAPFDFLTGDRARVVRFVQANREMLDLYFGTEHFRARSVPSAVPSESDRALVRLAFETSLPRRLSRARWIYSFLNDKELLIQIISSQPPGAFRRVLGTSNPTLAVSMYLATTVRIATTRIREAFTFVRSVFAEDMTDALEDQISCVTTAAVWLAGHYPQLETRVERLCQLAYHPRGPHQEHVSAAIQERLSRVGSETDGM